MASLWESFLLQRLARLPQAHSTALQARFGKGYRNKGASKRAGGRTSGRAGQRAHTRSGVCLEAHIRLHRPFTIASTLLARQEADHELTNKNPLGVLARLREPPAPSPLPARDCLSPCHMPLLQQRQGSSVCAVGTVLMLDLSSLRNGDLSGWYGYRKRNG